MVNRFKKGRFIFFLFLFSFVVSSAYPQFFKVYGYKTRAENEAEIVLWNTYIADSDLNMTFFGGPAEREAVGRQSAATRTPSPTLSPCDTRSEPFVPADASA